MAARLLAVLLLLALAGCRGEPAHEVPAEVRETVTRQLVDAGIDIRLINQARGLFQPVDLTSRPAPDWLVDFSVVPSGKLCGTGGCPLQVWVKTGPAPYALAFDRQVLGHEIGRHDNGRRWLSVDSHGALCGGTGSDVCRYQFAWQGGADAPDGRFAAASIWGKPMRYEGPLAQAVPVSAPAGAVADALDAYRVACVEAGGSAVLDDALAYLPDLNRDGRPELLFDASLAYCQHDDEPVAPHCAGEACRTQLFTEQGGQSWRAAWSGQPFAYAVDFSQPDPRLMIRPADCEANCAEQVLAWRDGERRFVPVSP